MNAKECENRAKECLEMMNSATGTSKVTLRELAQNWLILADQARTHEDRSKDRSKDRTVDRAEDRTAPHQEQ